MAQWLLEPRSSAYRAVEGQNAKGTEWSMLLKIIYIWWKPAEHRFYGRMKWQTSLMLCDLTYLEHYRTPPPCISHCTCPGCPVSKKNILDPQKKRWQFRLFHLTHRKKSAVVLGEVTTTNCVMLHNRNDNASIPSTPGEFMGKMWISFSINIKQWE